MRCTAYCCWSYEFECYFPLLHEASVYNNYFSVKRLIRIGDHVSSRFEFAIKGAREQCFAILVNRRDEVSS